MEAVRSAGLRPKAIRTTWGQVPKVVTMDGPPADVTRRLIAVGGSVPATVSTYLPDPDSVRVNIFDVQGAEVRSLVHDHLPAGEHSFSWDGTDSEGKAVGPGVYFVGVDIGRSRTVDKVIVE